MEKDDGKGMGKGEKGVRTVGIGGGVSRGQCSFFNIRIEWERGGELY